MTTAAAGADLNTIRDQIEVLRIAEGFFQSSILFALLKLRVFELLGEGEKPVEELAAETNASAERLRRLLNAGVVLKLLDTADERVYRLTPISRSVLLPSKGESYLGDWIRNLPHFAAALSDLAEVVLSPQSSDEPFTPCMADQEQTREFTLAMHDYAALRGKELTRYLDTTGCKSLLDLGCGPGTYAFLLGLANPQLELYLLDSPGVLEIAKEVQARYPIRNKIHYVPADGLRDELDGQYDLVLVSNTLHMLGPEKSRALLRRLFKSVKQGGSLVVQAQFLRDDRLGERWPVLLDLIQLCITSTGENHSVAETKYWMEEAGFSSITFCPMGILNTNSFIRGFKT